MDSTEDDIDAPSEIITIPHKTDVPALFSKDKGIENLVVEIEKQARSIVIDHTTAAGRKDIKSLAARVSRSKTLIDEVGKEQNEERNALNKLVNAQRNLAKERLDALRDEIKKPVQKWEADEAERVRQLLIRMDTFDLEQANSFDSSAKIKGIINNVEATDVDDTWQEKEADAKAGKAAALVKFKADLSVAEARERADAELEELRAEKAEREAAEAARLKAEQEAELERKREAEAAEKEELARQEALAQAKAEQEAAEARHREELAEAARREERAAQAERDRIAAEKKEQEDKAAARAADRKHRQKIKTEIVSAITEAGPENWEELVDAMLVGEIPHVKVIL